MSGFRPYEALLAVVETVAAAALLIRFLYSGLYKIYRFFFAYLVIICIQGVIPFFISARADAYAWFFFSTETIVICLYALIVLELYSLVLRQLPGISSVAHRYIQIAILIAIAISVLLLSLEQTPGNRIARFFSFERPIVSSLLCFVFLITAFLAYYPIRLSRNVIYYTVGYVIYFTSKGMALFLRNIGHQWDKVLSPAMLAISTACLIFWTVALRGEREQESQIFRHRWNPEDEQRLLNQLDAVNASLLRARK